MLSWSFNDHHRIQAAERIDDGFFRGSILHPTAVHNELILIASRPQGKFLHPATVADTGQGCGSRVPVVERTGHEHFARVRVVQHEPDARQTVRCLRRIAFVRVDFYRAHIFYLPLINYGEKPRCAKHPLVIVHPLL